MRAQAANHAVRPKQLRSWLRRFHATSRPSSNSYLDHRSVDSPPAIPFYMLNAPSPFKLPVSLIRSQSDSPHAHTPSRIGVLDPATGDVDRFNSAHQLTPLVSRPEPERKLKDDNSRRGMLVHSAEEDHDVETEAFSAILHYRNSERPVLDQVEQQRSIPFAESSMEALLPDTKERKEPTVPDDFYTIGFGSKEQEEAVKALERSIRKAGNPKLAWRLYERFKEDYGPRTRMWEYHKIVISFVAIQQPGYAFRVLKDSEPSSGPRRPKVAKTETCRRLVQLQLVCNTESELNDVSRYALDEFRSPMHQRALYGRWLKKLTGLRKRRAAADVVAEMIKKNPKPSTKQLTGLIELFLNSEDPKDRENGEQEAFKMIDLKIQQVRHARGTTNPGEAQPEQQPVTARDGIFSDHPVPSSPADIDTFSLLAAYFLKEKRIDECLLLEEKLLRSAQIPINTRLLNTLLKALLRADKPRRAWRLMQRCKDTTQPTVETFAIFWTIMVKSYDMTRPSRRDDLPSPRSLFKFMMDYFKLDSPTAPSASQPSQTSQPPQSSPPPSSTPLSPTPSSPIPSTATSPFQTIPQTTPDLLNTQALKLLSRNRDFFGCIVAMYGFRLCFNVLPTHSLMQHIAQYVASLGAGTKAPRNAAQRQRMLGSPQHKRNLFWVIWTLKLLHQQRMQRGGG